MEIVITIGGVAKGVLVYSDELSTVVDLSRGNKFVVSMFNELLNAWLSAKKYEFEDFQKYGKRG